jgi:hypothetical protein
VTGDESFEAPAKLPRLVSPGPGSPEKRVKKKLAVITTVATRNYYSSLKERRA